jgi:DNA-binding LytR/AlgR family response regulator
MPLTCLLADDEPVLRFHLQRLLEELWPELDAIITAANGDEAWTLIQEARPQVVFLDIRMPGLNGLEVARKMQEAGLSRNCQLVFLTAYDQHALEAFEREALDYLLKPVDEKRLEKTLERLRQQLQQQQPRFADLQQLQQLLAGQGASPADHPPPEQYLKWLKVQKGEVLQVLDVEQILVFQAEDKYTTLITPEGDHLIRTSLKQLEQALNPDLFWRIHRRTLVQVSQIDRVTRSFTGQLEVKMHGIKQPFTVSRRFADRFKQN